MSRLSIRFHRIRKARAFTLLELVIVLGVILVLLGLVLGVGSIVVGQSEQRQVKASMLILDAALAEFETQAGRPIIFQGAEDSGNDEHCGYRNGVGNSDVYYDVPIRPYEDVRFTTATEDGGFGWVSLGDGCPPWSPSSLALTLRKQSMAATLAVLQQNPTCAEMIAKADPSLLHAVQCIIGSNGSNPIYRSTDIKEFVDPWAEQVLIIYPGRVHDSADIGELIKDEDGTIRTLSETFYGICRNRRPLLVSAGPDTELGGLHRPPGNVQFKYAQDNIYSYEPQDP